MAESMINTVYKKCLLPDKEGFGRKNYLFRRKMRYFIKYILQLALEKVINGRFTN